MTLRQPVADDLIEGVGAGSGERGGSGRLAVIAQRRGGIAPDFGIEPGNPASMRGRSVET
jgi:hypothetical protein